jgi:hypothetical protein
MDASEIALFAVPEHRKQADPSRMGEFKLMDRSTQC